MFKKMLLKPFVSIGFLMLLAIFVVIFGYHWDKNIVRNESEVSDKAIEYISKCYPDLLITKKTNPTNEEVHRFDELHKRLGGDSARLYGMVLNRYLEEKKTTVSHEIKCEGIEKDITDINRYWGLSIEKHTKEP